MPDEQRHGPELNTGEEILKAVEERRNAEAASYPDASKNNGKVANAFVEQCMQANELGDGLLYRALCEDQYIYNVSSGEWYSWAGHFWRRDVHDQALAAVEKVVGRLLERTTEISGEIDQAIQIKDEDTKASFEKKREAYYKRISRLRTDRGRTACLKFARTCEDPLTIEGGEFDMNPWLFTCRNGAIDLETGKFRPGRQSDYLSLCSPVEWQGIEAPAEKWQEFLLQVFAGDEELVTYIHRLLGYATTGLTHEHIMPVLYGKGRNGKGTLVEILSYVLGSLAGPVQAEILLAEWKPRSSAAPSPDIMGLKGLRMAFSSETDEGRRFSSSKVKWLTGGDELVGRNPYDRYDVHFNDQQ